MPSSPTPFLIGLAIFTLVPLVACPLLAQRTPRTPPVWPFAATGPVRNIDPMASRLAPVRPQTQPNVRTANYGRLPLSFEANKGQADSRVKFLSRGDGYNLFLTFREAVFTLQPPTERRHGSKAISSSFAASPPVLSNRSTDSVLRMQLVGAEEVPEMAGQEALPGISNYFIGSDPKKWRTGIKTYRKVQYHGVYPGIDLVYYGSQRQLEYDFIVAPKADPGKIALRFEGANRLKVDKVGGLIIALKGGLVRWHKPSVYQERHGKHIPVDASFVMRGKRQIGFVVAKYDRSMPLVIDPLFDYSTYLRNSLPHAITVDRDGNAYVTGSIANDGFPMPETALTGEYAAFVVKLNPSGSQLLYSTYFGGTNITNALAVALDGSSNVVIAGLTTATDLPILHGFQTANAGGTDAFIAKISTNGAGLLYSTYIGGASIDEAYGVAVTAAGNAYVCGTTYSTQFPTKSAFQPSLSGFEDAFVTVVSTTASGSASLLYSTFLGGSMNNAVNESINAVAVGADGSFYVTGSTGSTDFPTVNAYQATNRVGATFVTAFSADGSRLLYSSYLNGDIPGVIGYGGERYGIRSFGITVDSHSNAYITGQLDVIIGNSSVAHSSLFVARFNCAAVGTASLVFASVGPYSYPSADGPRSGTTIALDNWGNILVGGNFFFSGSFDEYVYVKKMSADGQKVLFQTLISGASPSSASNDTIGGFAADADGNVYVAGTTDTIYFPVTHHAFQTTPTPGSDRASTAFVVKMPTITSLDFDGNDQPDFLFQNSLDGSLVYWIMSRDTETEFGYLFPASPGSDWKVVGTADLNGDNGTDILFQNNTTGYLAYWLMEGRDLFSSPSVDGTVAAAIGFITPKYPGSNWRVVGMADFNRDGYTDILFQNSENGDLYVWYMRGTTMMSGSYMTPQNPGAGWRVVALGDFNNDGQSDILFQHTASGSLYVWYLHDSTLYAGTFLNPANPGPGWRVAGLAAINLSEQFNGDAQPKILFQNASTGKLAYWVMDGPNLVSVGLPSPWDPGGPQWKLVGPR